MTELRTKLPYTEAVLLEVQRIGNVVPTALFHTTTTATTIENYAIPGVNFINIYAQLLSM